ncbi:hypothetical protein FIC_01049 [Flavobacteriaceae bacterium 3519-10]|nr:hypothetical protein FIC_01049 [Flavobacteriaceae bacterium 3519-10]
MFWATLSAFRSRFRRGGELHSSRVAVKVFLENLFWISGTCVYLRVSDNHINHYSMIFQPEIFYSTYQKDFHKIKAIYLKKLLEFQDKEMERIFEENYNDFTKENIHRAIKSEIRQNLFHCIETFFDIFFALDPKETTNENHVNILKTLTQAKWRKNLKRIEKIAENPNELKFLDEFVETNHGNIKVAEYLFYYNLNLTKDVELKEKVTTSIEAIKYLILILSKEFSNRDEYNSYKHSIRLIPAVDSFSIFNPVANNVEVEFNLEDSLSYYVFETDNETQIEKIITKTFDVQRDINLTILCSNLISQLIYHRDHSYNKLKENISVSIFREEKITELNKRKVQIQKLIYTIKYD